MHGIIGIIVLAHNRRHPVEPFDEHPFGVEIRKTQRTVDACHSFIFAPYFYCFQQSARHFLVIRKVQPAEARTLVVPLFIRPVVNDAGDTTG